MVCSVIFQQGMCSRSTLESPLRLVFKVRSYYLSPTAARRGEARWTAVGSQASWASALPG